MSTPTPAAGPACVQCGAAAVVNWARRPTTVEITDVVTAQQDYRDQLLALDPNQPPTFGPLPTAGNSAVVVYACGTHAISMDLAALIHQSTCTAPNTLNLPGCDCTPETPPPPPTTPVTKTLALPDHWLPAVA